MISIYVIAFVKVVTGLPIEGFYFGYENKMPLPGDQWLIRFGLFNPHPEHPTDSGMAQLDFHESFIPERPQVNGIIWHYYKRPYEHLHLDFANSVSHSMIQVVPIWGQALFDRYPNYFTLKDWTDVPYSAREGLIVVKVNGREYNLWLHKRPSAAADDLATTTE
ncbi:hypothetical protein Pmar_PMAR017086 [Perkinsus marinus ATCC 50983]|uniref:Uncharacterized protein n=1 Tax=Perkinsus marinus (strain ATCC 50983 / TXsc) TaxID=423536 RepID=C5LSI7_PERM5|nr:hypothetical protein Pmar_PMAR017086 [Perkinsus marinus ATCC 50983]EER00228.1 hypothetical protein Pmar_PMAR017086 [Perkinsus marinus ATCC 50983]|mmetsp:Transcript_8171/g.8108  ORF Transcript_8171/g.8108 Transcript_8171/m.8108 type:complete len:164 (-) Transcript_8171:313-804(-)|eukprot:XP_002767510.1 hypothetical protein Pmar_PMAR017086 [Perkinsus marinus ATCC 50983]